MKTQNDILDKLDDQQLTWQLKIKLEMVLEENLRLAKKIKLEELIPFVNAVESAKRIFFVAAGRSGLALRAAAMRMMHLGLTVYVVGETTTPAIGAEDLLIAASGSGTTSSILRAAEKAVSVGACLVALTTNPSSPLASLASYTVSIPAAEKEDHHGGKSGQYAGSLFEQFLFLLMDAVFQSLWKIDGSPAEELWNRHANLE